MESDNYTLFLAEMLTVGEQVRAGGIRIKAVVRSS